MKSPGQEARGIRRLLRRFAPGIVLRGMALGILMAVGTGLFLSMNSGPTSEATSTAAQKVDPGYRFTDLEDEPLSVEFLRTYVYPEEAGQ